jgi:hypothetical protein
MDELESFPPDLASAAVVLSGEPAWPADSARSVIEYLRQHEIAIVGVETWVRVGVNPRVLESSRYNVPNTGDWKLYVECNATHALEEISSAQESEGTPKEVLFNLTWISRGEL